MQRTNATQGSQDDERNLVMHEAGTNGDDAEHAGPGHEG